MASYSFKDPFLDDLYMRAQEGDVEAQVELADIFYDGVSGVKEDKAEAMIWYSRASRYSMEALTKMGDYYLDCTKRGMKKDKLEYLKLAIEKYKIAAKNNYLSAVFMLGVIYENGYSLMEPDAFEAFKWYRKAADLGYYYAYKKLASMYESGSGVEQSYLNALENYQKVLEHPVDYSFTPRDKAEILVKLGSWYYAGISVPQDAEAALRYFKEAADYDDPEGKAWLGMTYYDGKGNERNYKKALYHFMKSSNQDSIIGHLGMAKYYLEGLACPMDREKARPHLMEAARRLNPEAIEMKDRYGF